MSENKIERGQFYTIRNPFVHPLVGEWWSRIPHLPSTRYVEPFGGANHIIKLFVAAQPQVDFGQWTSYDLEPEAVAENQVSQVSLIQRDTILDPPVADVVVTNPPYLAKNSATRRGLRVDFRGYQDLYEVALEGILANASYVAAIIPESFLTRTLFRDRLFGFISLTENLFDDTDFPVGLALWQAEETTDYPVWIGASRVGMMSEIRAASPVLSAPSEARDLRVSFNVPSGGIGLYAVDGTKEASIRFVEGDAVAPDLVKHSSRAVTRIAVLDAAGDELVRASNVAKVVEAANRLLSEYRAATHDVLLTSFKGLRADSRYRRRLDWRTAASIVEAAVTEALQ